MLTKFAHALTLVCMPLALICGEAFHIPRDDGSWISGYVSAAESDSFPIVIGLQGTSRDSTHTWFEFLKSNATGYNVSVCCIEQRGIHQYYTDLEEYRDFNSLDVRLNDYARLIAYLQENRIPGWNGQIWLLGESEGGLLASQLAPNMQDINGVILIGSGGGMPIQEELRITMQQYLDSQALSLEEQSDRLTEFSMRLDWIKNHPSEEELFLGNSTQWWASLLNMTPIASRLQERSIPVIIVHGTNDMHIPVESADLLVKALNRAAIPTTYLRIESGLHTIRDQALFKELFSKMTISQENAFSMEYSSNYNYRQEALEELFVRGSGKAEVGGSAQQDHEGNTEKEAHASIEHKTDDGAYIRLKGSAHEYESANGTSKAEGRVQVDIGWTWGDEKKK